jgi:hypothetical protein
MLHIKDIFYKTRLFTMFPRTKNRKAISAVLTTIIILVASIVLGAGVVVYSTSLFQSGGQQQAIQIQGLKIWVNGTYTSGAGGPGGGIGWGAAAIKNTGDKLIAINSITIRSASVPFSNWYAEFNQTRASTNFQDQFNYTQNDANGNLKGSRLTGASVNLPSGCVNMTSVPNPPPQIVIQEIPVSTGSPPVCLSQQSGPISMPAGSSTIVYYKLPFNLVSPSDAGISSTISFLAGSAPVSQVVRIGNP